MTEKLEEKIRCFLCRKQICGVKQEIQFIESEALESWNSKCWDSLSEILFKCKDHSLKYILCNGGYCTNCQKRIWDLDFTFKTLQKLEHRLGKLTEGVIGDIRINYETIANEINDTKAVTLLGTGDGDDNVSIRLVDLWGRCSYNEAVQMVFKALNSISGSSSSFKTNPRNVNVPSPNNKRKRKRPIRHPILSSTVALASTASNSHSPDMSFKSTGSGSDVTAEALSKFVVKLELPEDVNDEADYRDANAKTINAQIDRVLARGNDKDDDEDPFAVNNKQWIPSEDDDSWESNLSLDDDDDEQDEDYSDSDCKPSKKQKITRSRRKRTSKPRTTPVKTRRTGAGTRKSKVHQEDEPEGTAEQSEPSWKKNFICSENGCLRRFKDELGLQIHIRKDHLELPNPYHCTLCEKDFSGVSNLKSHLRRHEGTFRFPCPICQKGYHTKINLELHMESRHSAKSPDQVCQICSKRFKTAGELETHSTSVHQGPNPFTCEDCKVLFTNSGDLKSHVQQNHQTHDGPFCSICGKTFATLSYLKAHQRLIHPKVGTVLKCRTCGEKFEKISLLTAHRETHVEGETKACQCDQCGRSFKGKKGLAYHILTHTGEKPYKCKICGKGFRQSAHCKKHEEIHSGLQNYVCHICGKACTNKGNLRLHMKIHDKETGVPKIRKPSAPKKPKNMDEPPLVNSTCSTSEDLGNRMFQQLTVPTTGSQQFRFTSPSVDYYSSGNSAGLSYQYQTSQFPANFGGFKM